MAENELMDFTSKLQTASVISVRSNYFHLACPGRAVFLGNKLFACAAQYLEQKAGDGYIYETVPGCLL